MGLGLAARAARRLEAEPQPHGKRARAHLLGHRRSEAALPVEGEEAGRAAERSGGLGELHGVHQRLQQPARQTSAREERQMLSQLVGRDRV